MVCSQRVTLYSGLPDVCVDKIIRGELLQNPVIDKFIKICLEKLNPPPSTHYCLKCKYIVYKMYFT